MKKKSVFRIAFLCVMICIVFCTGALPALFYIGGSRSLSSYYNCFLPVSIAAIVWILYLEYVKKHQIQLFQKLHSVLSKILAVEWLVVIILYILIKIKLA